MTTPSPQEGPSGSSAPPPIPTPGAAPGGRRRRPEFELTPALMWSFGLHIFLVLLWIGWPKEYKEPEDRLIEIDLRDSEKEAKPLTAAKPPEVPAKPAQVLPVPPPRLAEVPPPAPVTPPKPQPEKIEKVKIEKVQVKEQKPVIPPPVTKSLPATEKPVAPETTQQKPAETTRARPRDDSPRAHDKELERFAQGLRNPTNGSGAPSNPTRARRDEAAGIRPDNDQAHPNLDRHPSASRRSPSSNPFDVPNTNRTTNGGMGDAPQEPLSRGTRLTRRDTGSTEAEPDRFQGGRAGGGAPGLGSTTGGAGSARGHNPELAGTDGAGGINLPRATARRGGGGQSNPDVFAYNDKTGRDNDRLAVDLTGSGPGHGGGAGNGGGGGVGGARGRGVGAGGDSDLGVLRARTGSGLGAGTGGNVGGGRGRGTGGAGELAGGGGGAGGGLGGGHGTGSGSGAGRGTSGRGRYAGGVPFGDPNGSGGGNTRGGGGTGGGPGGPGRGTRIARGGGASDGTGGDGGGGFGRGPGSGAGSGSGDGSKDGSGGGRGSRYGSGGRGGNGESAGDGDGGRGARARRLSLDKARLKREREAEQLIGRGIWAPGLVGEYFQDTAQHPDRPDATFAPGHAIDWPIFSNSKFQKVSSTLDFNWGTNPPGPGMKGTFWSARWSGKIFVPKDDTYEFFFDELDDAGRLVLDGKEIIKVWKVQKSSPSSGKMQLERGPHRILIEYVQGPATESSIKLSWRSTSFAKEVVGAYRPAD